MSTAKSSRDDVPPLTPSSTGCRSAKLERRRERQEQQKRQKELQTPQTPKVAQQVQEASRETVKQMIRDEIAAITRQTDTFVAGRDDDGGVGGGVGAASPLAGTAAGTMTVPMAAAATAGGGEAGTSRTTQTPTKNLAGDLAAAAATSDSPPPMPQLAAPDPCPIGSSYVDDDGRTYVVSINPSCLEMLAVGITEVRSPARERVPPPKKWTSPPRRIGAGPATAATSPISTAVAKGRSWALAQKPSDTSTVATRTPPSQPSPAATPAAPTTHFDDLTPPVAGGALVVSSVATVAETPYAAAGSPHAVSAGGARVPLVLSECVACCGLVQQTGLPSEDDESEAERAFIEAARGARVGAPYAGYSDAIAAAAEAAGATPPRARPDSAAAASPQRRLVTVGGGATGVDDHPSGTLRDIYERQRPVRGSLDVCGDCKRDPTQHGFCTATGKPHPVLCPYCIRPVREHKYCPVQGVSHAEIEAARRAGTLAGALGSPQRRGEADDHAAVVVSDDDDDAAAAVPPSSKSSSSGGRRPVVPEASVRSVRSSVRFEGPPETFTSPPHSPTSASSTGDAEAEAMAAVAAVTAAAFESPVYPESPEEGALVAADAASEGSGVALFCASGHSGGGGAAAAAGATTTGATTIASSSPMSQSLARSGGGGADVSTLRLPAMVVGGLESTVGLVGAAADRGGSPPPEVEYADDSDGAVIKFYCYGPAASPQVCYSVDGAPRPAFTIMDVKKDGKLFFPDVNKQVDLPTGNRDTVLAGIRALARWAKVEEVPKQAGGGGDDGTSVGGATTLAESGVVDPLESTLPPSYRRAREKEKEKERAAFLTAELAPPPGQDMSYSHASSKSLSSAPSRSSSVDSKDSHARHDDQCSSGSSEATPVLPIPRAGARSRAVAAAAAAAATSGVPGPTPPIAPARRPPAVVPVAPAAPQLWACSVCTFDNDPAAFACEMCNTQRPQTALSSTLRSVRSTGGASAGGGVAVPGSPPRGTMKGTAPKGAVDRPVPRGRGRGLLGAQRAGHSQPVPRRRE